MSLSCCWRYSSLQLIWILICMYYNSSSSWYNRRNHHLSWQKRSCNLFVLEFNWNHDTVYQQCLQSKLSFYQKLNTENICLRCYLNNKSQNVHINAVIYDLHQISKGAPQGSILGPLLFLTFSSDFSKCFCLFFV